MGVLHVALAILVVVSAVEGLRVRPLQLLSSSVIGKPQILRGPARPVLMARDSRMLAFSWSFEAEAGYKTQLFSLVLNGKTVYTGTEHSFAARGLDHSTCFEATVLAFVIPRDANSRGSVSAGSGWTKSSPALYAATASVDVPDVSGLEQAAAAQRQQFLLKATQAQDLGDCSLAGLTDLMYDAGASSSLGVVFQGRSDASVRAGILAARENCADAVCVGESRDVGDPTSLLSAQLHIATGDPRQPVFLESFAQLPPHRAALRYTDPSLRGLLIELPLQGCRARQGWPEPRDKSGRILSEAHLLMLEEGRSGPVPKAMACIALQCGHIINPMVLCLPSSAHARVWTSRLNEESAGARLLQRQAMTVHVSAGTVLRDNDRRRAEFGAFELTGWRVAFISSFLASLSDAGAGEGYWRVHGTERCSELPSTMRPALPDDPTTASAVPLGIEGGSVLEALARSVQDGSVEAQYVLGVEGTAFGSDLGVALRQMGAAGEGQMSVRWARAMAFQVIWALGVGRHALGLHHNGMLDLGRAVKLRQAVSGSASRRQWHCYRMNDGVLKGLPLPLDGRSDRQNTQGAIVKNNGVDGGGTPVSAGVSASAVAESGTVGGTSVGGSSNGVLPRDRLFTRADASDDACTGDARARAHVAEGGQPGRVRDAGWAGRSSMGSSDVGAMQRMSWCYPTNDVDGLRVILFGLEQAVLTRPALQYWRDGYSFPNAARRDDLADFGTAFCGMVVPRLGDRPDEGFGALCAAMVRGDFAQHPLDALQHSFFTRYMPPWAGAVGKEKGQENESSHGESAHVSGNIGVPESSPSPPSSFPPGEPSSASQVRSFSYAPATISLAEAMTSAEREDPQATRSQDSGSNTAGSKGTGAGSHMSSGGSGGSGANEEARVRSRHFDKVQNISLTGDALPGSGSGSGFGTFVGTGQLLRLLVPSVPFVALQDGDRLVVAWKPLRRAMEALQSDAPLPLLPRMFALWMDGVSVYSGGDRAHAFALPLPRDATELVRGRSTAQSRGTGSETKGSEPEPVDCHVFRAAAFYAHLGWTGLSASLRLGRDCESPEEVLLPHRSSLPPSGSMEGVAVHADRIQHEINSRANAEVKANQDHDHDPPPSSPAKAGGAQPVVLENAAPQFPMPSMAPQQESVAP